MPPKRGKKGAAKKAETEVVNSSANGTENDESPKNGETIDEEKDPQPAATKGIKRSASGSAKKGRKTKKTEEETNGEDAEEEPSTNQESSPKSTKRSAAKDESPKNIYGKKSKKTKKAELEKQVDEDDDEGKDDEPIETEENEEPSSTTSKKTSTKSKKKDTKKDLAEENGTNVETISNRPKRKAAPPTINVALKRTVSPKVVIKSKTKKKKASPTKQAPPKEQFEVESIIQMREKSGKREFLVKWKGYGKNQNTWEPEKNLNCPKILATFLKKEGKST